MKTVNPSNRRHLFRRHAAGRDFLLSRSEVEAPSAPETSANEAAALPAAKFPDLPSGSGLLTAGLQKVDDCQCFGAMVMQIDKPSPSEPDERQAASAGRLADVFRTMARVIYDARGLWGPWKGRLLGGFLPDRSGAECLEFAREIQNLLQASGTATVSIGLAVYPTLDYRKDQILANARKALAHAAFFSPNAAVLFDAISLNVSGDQFYEAGDLPAAISEYEQALRLDQANANVYNSLGVCHGLQGEYDAARQAFTKASELDPAEAMPRYNIGLVHLLQADYARALPYLQQAAERDDALFEVMLQLGRCHLELYHTAPARTPLEKAVALNPESGLAHRYLGEVYRRLAMEAAAVTAFQKALKYNPNDPAALSTLGWLLDHQGENFDIALTFCEQSVAIEPENGLYRYRLGRLYLKAGRPQDAHFQLVRAQTLGFDSGPYLNQAAEAAGSSRPL
jgi:tetratricopeptide (TPR) repeat protein